MTWEMAAVVGLGFLGRGIAACLLSHGFRVVGHAPSTAELDSAEARIQQAIDEVVDHGLGDPTLRQRWRDNYIPTLDFQDLAKCTFVIESVAEDIDVKSTAFDNVERIVDPVVPIASNTSAIPISVLQRSRLRPERFLGMHWAEPAHATRFLELIRGELTGDAAFERAVSLAERCGKEPSVVNRDLPGFIANRLGYALYREALHLLEAGFADAETIDRSFRNSVGLWATLCGPLRWIDLTGGPKLYAKAMEHVLPTLAGDATVPRPLADLAAAGALGVVNGRGFFSYSPEEAAKWEQRWRQHAWAVLEWAETERPLENRA